MRCMSSIDVSLFYLVIFFHKLTSAPNRQTLVSSFPSVLVIHAKKFQLVNWVPAKLGSLFVHSFVQCSFPSFGRSFVSSFTFSADIPLVLPDEDVLEFTEKHFGKGLQPDEEELPEDEPAVQEGVCAQWSILLIA